MAVVRCEFGASLGFARLSRVKVNLSSWSLWYALFTLCRTKFIEFSGLLVGGSSNLQALFISFLGCISRWIIPQYLILLQLMLITILEITQTPHHHSLIMYATFVIFFKTLFFVIMLMRKICHGFHTQNQPILLNMNYNSFRLILWTLNQKSPFSTFGNEKCVRPFLNV